MIGHRTYLDARCSPTTRAVKPPLARGHRKWLNIASGMSAFGQDPQGLEAKPASPTRKGDAQ